MPVVANNPELVQMLNHLFCDNTSSDSSGTSSNTSNTSSSSNKDSEDNFIWFSETGLRFRFTSVKDEDGDYLGWQCVCFHHVQDEKIRGDYHQNNVHSAIEWLPKRIDQSNLAILGFQCSDISQQKIAHESHSQAYPTSCR